MTTQGPVGVTAQITGTINLPYVTPPPAPAPAPAYVPVPNQCFLCMRTGNYTLAVTVYKATYLCATCVRSLPDEMIINEFPPTL